MKKFIVDKVELMEVDGFKYYAIFDKNNNDWYEQQKDFEAGTLKVMYDKDTLKVLSINKDVSMIAPTMSGDVVEETEWQEVDVNPNLYFVGGKLVELKDYETIKNGEIEFDRAVKIEYLKAELSNLKTEYSEKEFIFKDKYVQKNRELDKNNLNSIATMLIFTKQVTFERWKFKDIDRNDIYVTLTAQDILMLSNIMTSQTTKAMKIESDLINKIETLSNEELKAFDVRKEFEKLWKN